MMNILAINSGIGASACLLRNGRIVLAIQEERLSRRKAHMGFPFLCLDYLLVNHSDIMNKLDAIGLAGKVQGLFSKEEFLQRYETRVRSPEDQSLYKRGMGKLRSSIYKTLPESVVDMLRPSGKGKTAEDLLRDKLGAAGISLGEVEKINHHDCHAAAAYFGLGRDAERKYLIFTLDGGGDGECASVSVGYRGRLKRLAGTESGNSIGNLYSNITHLLGFTPHEHEYKLMGLAPYVAEKHSAKVKEVLKEYLRLSEENPLVFERGTPERSTWTGTRLADDLKRLRFDNIAAGLQGFTEELLVEWVRQGVLKTGIRDVLLGGGVFMNVKLNQRISFLKEISSVNVFPSCGDESNAIGCAFLIHSGRRPEIPIEFSSYTLGPSPLYDLEQAKEAYNGVCRFEEVENPARTGAELIAAGHILARCAGPMEFGARALGNRSILCDSSNPDMVERVNFLIKQRDFWMPFAPAILKEDADKYLVIPPTLPPEISPYMMFTFDSTERRGELCACLQRGDKTARAQIVSREINPEFHELLSYYKDLTGRGAMMNTSFNIHGHPIVMGSMQAVEILANSNLDYLLLENILVSKK